MSHCANIGYIRSVALPVLKEILEPIRVIVLKRRIDLSMVLSNSANSSSSSGGGGEKVGNSTVNIGMNGNNGIPPHNRHQMIGLSVSKDGSGHQGNSTGSGLNTYG